MRLRSSGLLLAATSLLLLGCSGSPAEPPPEWPADGRTLPVGRYAYSIAWPAAPGVEGGTRRGEIIVREANEMQLTAEWTGLDYELWDWDFIPWQVPHDAYRMFVGSRGDPFANIEHFFHRPGGAERVECRARIQHFLPHDRGVVPATPEPGQAQCTLTWKGRP